MWIPLRTAISKVSLGLFLFAVLVTVATSASASAAVTANKTTTSTYTDSSGSTYEVITTVDPKTGQVTVVSVTPIPGSHGPGRSVPLASEAADSLSSPMVGD